MNNNKYPGHGRRPNCNDNLPWPPLRWDKPLEEQYENKYNLDIQDQINEDTCEEHGVFCCEECFDMRPIEDSDV